MENNSNSSVPNLTAEQQQELEQQKLEQQKELNKLLLETVSCTLQSTLYSYPIVDLLDKVSSQYATPHPNTQRVRDVIDICYKDLPIGEIFLRGKRALLAKDADEYCRSQIIHILVDSGADINYAPGFGETALMCAAKEGYTKTAQTLIDREADIDAVDYRGRTALMEALRCGREEIIYTLIKNGADVNIADNEGNTCLMEVALVSLFFFDHKKIIQTLIENGANIEAVNNEGNTALALANSLTTDTLIENGADITNESPANREKILGNILSSTTLKLLAVTTPDGELRDKVMAKLLQCHDYREEEVVALTDLKQNIATTGLTEDQQRKVIAFKIGVKPLRNNSTYLAAILPDEELSNEIIQTFNEQNPKQPLDQEKIKMLRCIAYGINEKIGDQEVKIPGLFTKDICDENGQEKAVIDYQKAGEVIWKLASNEHLFALTEFAAENLTASQTTLEPDLVTNKKLVLANSYLTEKLNNYLTDESLVGNLKLLEIFQTYKDLPLLRSYSEKHPTAQNTTDEAEETSEDNTPDSAITVTESRVVGGESKGGCCTIM